MRSIRYEHRVFLTGQTLSGKSTLAKELHLSAKPPTVVLDPTASEICASVGAALITDPYTWPDSEAGRWRFVPKDPFDLDAYEALYAQIWRRLTASTDDARKWANCHVWADEAGDCLPVNGAPKAARQFVYRGAKVMGGHLACHTRPREVYRHLLTDAAHIGVFDTPDPADRQYLAENAGVPAALLSSLLDALPEKGFLWINRIARPRRITPCPALVLG